jgi:transcriptional regulator with XRE-family HTH domain
VNALILAIGQKIRTLRNAKGLTLADLAARIQVSASLISQLERGGVNPSLSLLKSISDALEIPLGSLIEGEEQKAEVSSYQMSEKERKTLITEGRVHISLLTRSLDLDCEFVLMVYPPGSSSGREKYKHEGVECGLLLEGELDVELEDRVHTLKPGDTITFRSDIPHRLINRGRKPAKGVWVNSTPWIFSTK